MIVQLREQGRRKVEFRLRLLEAGFFLVTARVLLAVIPFARLMRLLGHPRQRAEVSEVKRLQTQMEVRSAVNAMQRSLGDHNTCLHRALAAHVMLRRRGISSTLYFGVARLAGERLITHAWLQHGNEGVIGSITAKEDGYTVVARYPEDGNSSVVTEHYVRSSLAASLGENHGQFGNNPK